VEARLSKLLGMPSFGLLYIGKLCVFAELAQNTPIWPVLDLSSPGGGPCTCNFLDV
jgi:hypothetical protein